MDEIDLQLLSENPDWQRLLVSYQDSIAALPAPAPEQPAPRGVGRLVDFEGLDAEELQQIHGQLIAYGFLKVELEAGRSGLLYQVTTTGRRTLQRLAGRLPSENEPDADEAESASSVLDADAA